MDIATPPVGRTVLVVDEHPRRLRAMQRMLERRDVLVVTALSAQEGLGVVEQISLRAAIVQHDLEPAGGNDFLAQLAHLDSSVLRVVVGPLRSQAAAAQRHLYSPVDVDELLHQVGLPSTHAV
jgi:ActR/RegA family two-component response regulator